MLQEGLPTVHPNRILGFSEFVWEFAKGWGGGAKRIVRFAGGGGGGGKRTIKCPLQNQFLEASENGIRLVCARFL